MNAGQITNYAFELICLFRFAFIRANPRLIVNAHLTQIHRRCLRMNVAIFQASMAFQGSEAIV